MISNAGVSNGTVTAQKALTSYGTIVASGNQYNGLTVFQNSTMNYLEDKSGQITLSSSDATAVINAAIGNAVSGDSILIEAGTYVMTNSVHGSSVNSVTLTLASGAILQAPSNFRVPIIFLNGVSNWVIQGGEIDGNSANQPYTAWGISGFFGIGVGIELKNCANCIVQNMYIHDIRIYGVSISYGSTNVKLLNNHITNCGANGIDVGEDWSGAASNCLAEGNLVESCSDVCIDVQGVNCQVINNTVDDIISTTNGMVNTHWAIGIESPNHISGRGASNLIQGNTIHDCRWGVSIEIAQGTTATNTITSNNIYNVTWGIMYIDGNGNTANSNTISARSSCIYIGGNTNSQSAKYNILSGNTGVYCESGTSHNTCAGNDYSGCTYSFVDYGTGDTNSP
jgi:hypothetical protein